MLKNGEGFDFLQSFEKCFADCSTAELMYVFIETSRFVCLKFLKNKQ